jgi:hypothetical protein
MAWAALPARGDRIIWRDDATVFFAATAVIVLEDDQRTTITSSANGLQAGRTGHLHDAGRSERIASGQTFCNSRSITNRPNRLVEADKLIVILREQSFLGGIGIVTELVKVVPKIGRKLVVLAVTEPKLLNVPAEPNGYNCGRCYRDQSP